MPDEDRRPRHERATLAQVTLYLAIAPKSDAAYRALKAVQDTVRSRTAEAVPLHLRNAPTKAMKSWGYGDGYRHAHQFEDAVTDMSCLPDGLAGTEFYQPTAPGDGGEDWGAAGGDSEAAAASGRLIQWLQPLAQEALDVALSVKDARNEQGFASGLIENQVRNVL